MRTPDFGEKDGCDVQILDKGALGALDPYIELGVFTDFKMQVWLYYLQNIRREEKLREPMKTHA